MINCDELVEGGDLNRKKGMKQEKTKRKVK